MKKAIFLLAMLLCMASASAKTLIVYYSYTNNVHQICTELKSQLSDADMIRIEPAEKGLDYAANNYALGTQLLTAIKNNPNDASSYPAIDPVEVDMSKYDTVIVGAPLWWSQMAAPLQTFLFNYGPQMAGKNIVLIVSSWSSGISGVEADAKRLIPDGKFFSKSLWIRTQQTSDAASMISIWLEEIDYKSAGIAAIAVDVNGTSTVYDLNGRKVNGDLATLERGIYIVNRQKVLVK